MNGSCANLRRANRLRGSGSASRDPVKEMMIGPGMGGHALLAAATAGMTVDPIRLIADSGIVAQAVLLAPLGFSVLSWAVMVEPALALRPAEADSHQLHREMQSGP